MIGDWGKRAGRGEGGRGRGKSVQVDEFAFVVFHDCCGFGGLFGRELLLVVASA